MARMAVRERKVTIVVKPMTWARGISRLLAISFLALLACSAGGETPATPTEIDDSGISPAFVPLSAELQPAGGEKCQERTVRPDMITRVNLAFIRLEFPEGCVEEAVDIEACADRSYYAVDFGPDGTSFLVPVTVSFIVDANDLDEGDLDRLAVAHVLPGGALDILPHEQDVGKKWVTVTFSISHFSRYALVLD